MKKMPQDFEWDNIPREMNIDPLHEKHTLTALEILREAIRTGTDRAAEAKIGFAYERKDWLEIGEIAPLSGEHNYYNSSRDDIVVQVTVRFPRPDEKDSRFAKLEETLVQEATDARIAAADAELAAVDAAWAALEERKAKAQAKRNAIQEIPKK
jgi:hypothetical protein